MDYSKEQEGQFVEKIRAIQILRPTASLVQIQDAFHKDNIHLSIPYLMKLRRRLDKSRLDRMRSNPAAAQRVAALQERKEIFDSKLWAIVNTDDTPIRKILNSTDGEITPKDKNEAVRALAAINGNRISALNSLLKGDLEMLQAELDAGIFERHLGTIRHMPAPLNAEQKRTVIDAFVAWGIIKPKTVIDTVAKQTDDKPAAEQLAASVAGGEGH